MRARRAVLSLVSILCATSGAAGVPAEAAPTALSAVIACNDLVALGATTPCDVPAAGGTARYRFTVPSADTVRFRAAVPDSNPGRTLTLSKTDGTVICTKESFPQFDCAVPSAGNYRLDVTLGAGATVYTTIDSVLTATCGAPIDVSVGNPGSAVHIADPGGSWCAGLDVAAGEGLEMVLDVNTDQGLDVSVYDDTGKSLCALSDVSAFARPGCLLTGGGDGYRVFASPYDDTAQDLVLIVTRITHPSGCVSRAPDAFGVAASRRAALTSHQQRCYAITGAAGQGIGAHLIATGGPTSTLFWQLRNAGGASLCTGGPADQAHRLSDCVLPADGQYYLFVSMLTRATVRYTLSLVDLSSDAGCAPASSTRWNTPGDAGALTGLGQVDCLTFSAAGNDIVRASVWGDTLATSGLLTAANGGPVCEASGRAECRLPATGTYRMAVSTTAQAPVDYHAWTIDMSSTAGCRATTPDTFGVAPDRHARFTDNVAVCYTFAAPAPTSSFFFRTAPVVHDLSTSGQVRSVDGSYTCSAPGCTVPSDGSYLYVITKAGFADDPNDTGSASAGLWRLDRPSGCTTIGTSFTTAPGTGDLADPGQVDCREFAASSGDQVLIRTSPAMYEVTSRVFGASGASVCFAVSNTCTLTGSGPYRMLSYAGPHVGDYAIRVASLTRAAGCGTVAATPFGRAPARAFDIADDIDLHCYKITMPDLGLVGVRMVDVTDTTFHPSVALYGQGASGFCSVSSEFGSCPVTAPGRYLLVASGNEAASGTFGWIDLAATAGCTTGPTLAFGTAPTRKQISSRGAVDCMTLPLGARDRARFAFGPSAGADLHALLVSHAGVTTCDFRSSDLFSADCAVPRSEGGPGRLFVYAEEDGGTFTGDFRMHAWRLNNPTGCTDIGSLRSGFGPIVDQLADKNDEACYVAHARDGTLAVTTSNDDVVEEAPLVQFFRANGALSCGVTGSGSCVLGNNTYAMLVRRSPDDADFTGHYRVQGTCTNGRCGP